MSNTSPTAGAPNPRRAIAPPIAMAMATATSSSGAITPIGVAHPLMDRRVTNSTPVRMSRTTTAMVQAMSRREGVFEGIGSGVRKDAPSLEADACNRRRLHPRKWHSPIGARPAVINGETSAFVRRRTHRVRAPTTVRVNALSIAGLEVAQLNRDQRGAERRTGVMRR
ncbi:hypothetical protein [Cognatilysobacter terrigena]|uniref:hypothetical protein n=1 Tax=Cognatilysobacter terrigena TaxID=2488749 RepID=UPI001060BCAB|nr:hypothetical protein [Lysobacter terrigena]